MDLAVRVYGRPAPQGSHEIGANGHVMHSSKFLAPWRHRVNKAVREEYLRKRLTFADMPLIAAPREVHLYIVHYVMDEQCRAQGTTSPTGSPDVDKLLRATVDGLGEARVFANDSQVVSAWVTKERVADDRQAGAMIIVKDSPLSEQKPGESISMADGFIHSGQYRIVLERVGTDADGDRTWETVVEVTDGPDAIAETWLPSLTQRLQRELPTQEATSLTPDAIAAPGSEVDDKPRRKRRTKAEIAADEAAATAQQQAGASETGEALTVAPPMPATSPSVPGQVAVPPAAGSVPFNPFAQG